MHQQAPPFLALRRSTNGRRSRGFSLIELSVVLVIMTALLGGGIAMTIAAIDRAAYETTRERMDAIQKALIDYVIAFGSLPCPADITAATNSSTYGVGTGTAASCDASCSAANFANDAGIGTSASGSWLASRVIK